jgi:hypothetical protein
MRAGSCSFFAHPNFGEEGRQMIIASNPTAAIPMIKKANAAGSCSSQYLCTRMNVPYPTARAPIHYAKGKQVVNLLLQSSHIEMKTEKAYPLLSSS